MEILKISILSIVQGITELLPISSSGHLILLGKIFEIDTTSVLLSVLHISTTLAIIIFFRKELFKKIFTKEKLLFYFKILIASIPAAIAGFFLDDFISERLRATWIIAVSLIIWGIVMIFLEQKKTVKKETNLEDISWKQSIAMGIGQTFALIPGTSRSGITTITGMLSGLDKYTALEYSFMLGIPVLLGSSVYEITKSILSTGDSISAVIVGASVVKILVVALIPFVVGYVVLYLLQKVKKSNWLTVFGIYRIVLGILILVTL